MILYQEYSQMAHQMRSVPLIMGAVLIILLFLTGINGLKIWLPNTDLNNNLNWDKGEPPKNCDFIRFLPEIDVATFWNLKNQIISGLSLPKTGDVIFSPNTNIIFRDKEKCTQAQEFKFIRSDVKGWLDPDNWKSDSPSQWLPHSERVPCAGEAIFFPPERTFAIQLPSTLVPTGEITFDHETVQGDAWSDFLKTDLGFQIFKGSADIRSVPWRNDIGCFNNKKCICGRSSYTIREGLYKDVEPRIFEEAVCLYAMPKCLPSQCYSPVVPEGHCCGICGAVINIQDETQDGLNISDIQKKVAALQEEFNYKKELKIYVGRTKDENIQLVTVAENPADAIKSHIFADIIRTKFTDEKFQGKLSLRMSGLTGSNYIFNSVSGVVFGTLIMVLLFFVSIFYVYLILPKKIRGPVGNYSFTFARFENSVNEAGSEENLEIGVEPEATLDLPQAFDNPMYSGNMEPRAEVSMQEDKKPKEELNTLEGTSTKEYSNPVYTELEKSDKSSDFMELDEAEKFSEIEL